MAQRRRARERRRARNAPAAPGIRPVQTDPRTPERGGPSASPSRPVAASSILAAIRARPAVLAVGAAITAAAFALYVATAARDIVFGDTPELTAVALTFGVAHPPGYPVFTMVGWLFGQLPVGSGPFRIALLSVVCHAATIGVVYATTYRFARSVPAAAVAAAALAFEPLFWSWSLVGEVFPLNDLLAATMLLLVALWHEQPQRKGLLVAGGLVGGLGAANHQTILLLGPAVLYVLWRRRNVLLRDPRILVNAAIAFAIGLLPYLELLVAAARQPAWNWGDLRGLGDLPRHVLRQDYGTASLISDVRYTGGSPVERLGTLFQALDAAQWILLAIGTWYALRTMRWYATYLLIAFAVAGPVFIVYSNANVSIETTLSVLQRFFLMPHTVIAPLAGFAVPAVGELAARLRLTRRLIEPVAAGVAIAAALAFVPFNYGQIDQRDNHRLRTFGEDLLGTVKPNSVFLAGGDPVVFSVGYLQTIEGERPDVTTVFLPIVAADWYIRELKRAHPDLVVTADRFAPGAGQMRSLIDANRRRPIAAIGDLGDTSSQGAYWFYSRGLIFEVRPEPVTVTLDEMTEESEKILATYHAPPYDSVQGPYRTWDRLTLVDYSQGYYRVGNQYEQAGDSLKTKNPKQSAEYYEGARRWYERALQVLPTLAEANAGLRRLTR